MRRRVRAWLEETHGAGFELTRHFLFGLFDNEAAAAPGEWVKAACGALAALLSAGILGLTVYWNRYALLWNRGTPALFRGAMREDELSLIAISMGVTALLTILQWQSLFPNRRDCLAFGGWPVSAREIFTAKFFSLLLVFIGFVLAATVIPGVLFSVVTSSPWRPNPSMAANAAANFAAAAGGCVFAFFSLLALQGILLNMLPVRAFARVSRFAQGVLFIGVLGALPLMGRWPTEAGWFPTAWFLALWESMLQGSPAGRAAILAMTAPFAVTVLSYALSYQRYRRLMVEGGTVHSAPQREGRGALFSGGWLLERWIGDPREQAVFAFIWKTLVRSPSHRLILLAYAGFGVGCITKGALDTPRPTLHDQGLYGFVVVLAPLAIAIAMAAGLRYLFSLPLALGANWLFQTTEPENRGVWLSAVERFVLWCGIAPVFLAAFPASVAVFGLVRATAAMALEFLAVLIVFEILYRHWRKLPFTCSRLPGQGHVLVTSARVFYAVAFSSIVAQVILYSSGELTAFVALIALEVVVWLRLRAKRRGSWAQAEMAYEDTREDAPLSLQLPQTLETDTAPATTPTAAAVETAMFSAGMVASRGLLPLDWEEEIDAERRRPGALAGALLQDVRYGLRAIRRNPTLSAVVVLTLTVGIGMNATVFSVVNGLAMRAHVYKDPDSFLQVIPQNRWQSRIREVSYSEYVFLRDNSRSLRQLAGWSFFPAMIGNDDSAVSSALLVSCNFFIVDGLDRPIAGRLLTAEDCRTPRQTPSVIVAESVWRNRFGSDPTLIGRTIEVNNRAVMVAGVVPDRTSSWTRPVKMWLPITAITYFEPGSGYFTRDDELWLSLAARLAPGYSRTAAQAELNMLAHQQDELHSGRKTIITITDGSWIEGLELTASGRDLMLIAFFLGAFVLVLLIACANVATLLLSRGAARKREIAVRLSLGAPRVSLVRMLVTESLLLAVIAGAISLLLAWTLPQPLFHLVATGAPDFPMPTDWRIFLYLCIVVVSAGILSGLAPAVESVKVDLLSSLKGSGATLSRTSGAHLQGWLVSAQVAMSMVLLVEAALFAQSEDRTLRASPGYLPDRVVVAPIHFPDSSTVAQATVRLPAMADRIKALPGVRAVAFSDGLPMMQRETLELRPPARADATQPVDLYAVSPGFLQTLGIALTRGRDFQDSDDSAVVVSQSLANLFWPRQNAVGQSLPLPGGAIPVVGVARDVATMRFGGSDNPAAYRLRRVHAHNNWMSVRFDTAPSRGGSAIRAALRASDPDVLVITRQLQAWIDQVTTILWNVVALIVILGLLATVLAAAGIYGAVSFAVGRRMQDLGIRVALGARRFDIVREVFVSAGKPVLRGLLLGLWLSIAAAASLRHNMANSPIRLDTTNPVLYLGAALILAIAAGIAMIGPARRGSRSDPVEALRSE